MTEKNGINQNTQSKRILKEPKNGTNKETDEWQILNPTGWVITSNGKGPDTSMKSQRLSQWQT